MTSLSNEGIARYLAVRDGEREAYANLSLGALSDRETRLVREAAVMGYVQGHMASGDAHIPPDSAIVWRVIDACRAMPDLYPVISALADAETS